MIAIRIMLGDACWIISALKDENFILTLVCVYHMDCRRNTIDLILGCAIPIVCVKTNGKVIRPSITQLCMSIRRYVLD